MGGPYESYAAYAVTLTFGDKTRKYETAALFGKNPDGTDKVHFLDLVSGGGGAATLDLLARTDMLPNAFLKTELANVPVVRKWLRENQQSCGPKRKGGLCCDTSRGRCGVDRSDLPVPTSSVRKTNLYLVEAGLPKGAARPRPFSCYALIFFFAAKNRRCCSRMSSARSAAVGAGETID